jgi:osmoprotectant transport system substrate-binding protein
MRRGRFVSKPSFARCLLAAGAVALGLSACASTSAHKRQSAGTAALLTTTATVPLPGAGKPAVTIGDKNFTEQFVLGELYYQALSAEGFSVSLNRNIGPTEVRVRALESGRLALYPEYLGIWNSAVAGYKRTFHTLKAAYGLGQRYARAHGLKLLTPTPFSDTAGIGVTALYSISNDVKTVADLGRYTSSLTLGGPPQFKNDPSGLPAVGQIYGVTPYAFKPLEVGAQYQALDQGYVQAAAVNTTDGQLASAGYTLLADPLGVFGVGQVVPVVSEKVIAAEGPAFAATIDAVSALLTTRVMRRLNAAVDVQHKDPHTVAKQFLQEHGLLPPPKP